MKSDNESLLSVSRAAMRLPEVLGTAWWADDEPAGAPPEAGTHDEEDVRISDESTGDCRSATRSFPVVARMEKPGFSPERPRRRCNPPAHVLVSLKGARMCLSSTYPIWTGEVPLAPWHASVSAVGWGGIP
jgi:hypothetical protein